jgi:hypothetical protein
MSFPFGNMFGAVVEDVNVPEGTVYLLGMRYKPIMLAPGQSLNDIPFEEQLERGIDWEATAKASAVITGIGPEQTQTSH